MSAVVSRRRQVEMARILAVRRCSEHDHPKVPGGGPCRRCLGWSDRRTAELVAAGLLRTDVDDNNAVVVERIRVMLNTQAWRLPFRRRARREVLQAVRGVLHSVRSSAG